MITFLKTALYNLSWLPLILSSLIYKIGVIVLYVEFLGSFWWAFLMLAFIFVGNFLTCFILKYVPVPSPAKYNIYIINSSDDNKEEEDIKVYQDLPFREKIFISYSNLFIISAPIKEVKYKNEISQVIMIIISFLSGHLWIQQYFCNLSNTLLIWYSCWFSSSKLWLQITIVKMMFG